MTVVERAPALRSGGFAVDFRGEPHLTVLQRMGILDEVKAAQTGVRGLAFVYAEGRTELALPASFLSGDVEIERGDLSRIIHDRTCDRVNYRFGDSIASLTDTGDRVVVDFDSGESASFDLIIGADHTLAFPRYEQRIRAYARGCQKLANGAGPFLAPRTRRGTWIRNKSHRLMTRRPMAGWLEKMTVKAAKPSGPTVPTLYSVVAADTGHSHRTSCSW